MYYFLLLLKDGIESYYEEITFKLPRLDFTANGTYTLKNTIDETVFHFQIVPPNVLSKEATIAIAVVVPMILLALIIVFYCKRTGKCCFKSTQKTNPKNGITEHNGITELIEFHEEKIEEARPDGITEHEHGYEVTDNGVTEIIEYR